LTPTPTPTPTNTTALDNQSINAIVVLGGAFNPIHAGHIVALTVARDHLEQNGIRVLAGYLAPASDGYVHSKYKYKQGFSHMHVCTIGQSTDSTILAT